MALRVLLADESSTIKKVMLLALQDFGVEVKAVPIGLDVIQVCKSFQPDLVFADVLLSKRSGYDVSADIKADPTLKSTPVVLMWSGFMELDEPRAQASKADRRLEKPFDADQLRALVRDLVPKLNENAISNFLSFPDLPEIVETPAQNNQGPSKVQIEQPPQVTPTVQTTATSQKSQWQSPAETPLEFKSNASIANDSVSKNSFSSQFEEFQVIDNLNDLDDPDEFQQIPLPGAKTKNVLDPVSAKENEDWRQGGLEQFRVAPAENFEVQNHANYQEILNSSVAITGSDQNFSIEELEDLAEQKAPAKKNTTEPTSAVTSSLDPLHAEEILREQVREVLQSIAWKIVPDIAERVVREEIQRLLKDAERF